MAVSPNAVCGSFCTWVLATTWLKPTGVQRTLITLVQTAAGASGTVTNQQWNDFLRVTGLWYQYYIAYIDQTTNYATIPSGIVQGDLLYGSASAVLSRLAKSTTANSFLKNSGANNNPAWARPATTDLSDVTTWTDYSSTSALVGWSSTTIKIIRYAIVGKIMFVVVYISGTSNNVNTTFTLPNNGITLTSIVQNNMLRYQDNGVYTNVGFCQVGSNSNTVTCYTNYAASTWSAIGTKFIQTTLVLAIN